MKIIDHAVQVAERALLDAKAPLSCAPAAPGRLVEACEADPQLEGEEPASDGPSPEEDSASSGR